MTLSVSIDPQTEARLRDLAEAAGKEITAYVSDMVQHAISEHSGIGADVPADF